MVQACQRFEFQGIQVDVVAGGQVADEQAHAVRRWQQGTAAEATTRLAPVVALLLSLCAVTAGASPRGPRRLSAERRAEQSMHHAPPV